MKGEVSMNKKRILIFIFVMFIATAILYGEPMEVLNHSFEYVDGELIGEKRVPSNAPDYWEWGKGAQSGSGVELAASDGEVCACISGVDSVYQPLNHVVAVGDEFTLMFDDYFLWSESDEWDCTFQGRLYCDDDGERIPIDYVEDNLVVPGGDWQWHEYSLTTVVGKGNPAVGKQLGIELAVMEISGVSWFGFDNVRLEGELAGVKCLNPTDGEEYVPIDTNLEWQPPTAYTPLYYDLYFGDDANEMSPRYFGKEPLLEKVDQTSHTPDKELNYETTYYWRVDAYEANDIGEICHLGNVWSFNTVPKEPVILEQPSGVTVPAGGTAEITIVAANTTMYEWYKEGTPAQLIDSGETMDTLVITDVQLSDEGLYYCKLINDVTNTSITSESVWLMTARLVAHWKFEDDLTDEVGKGTGNADGDWPGTYIDPNEGSPIPTPVYWYIDDANSIEGKAILMPGDGKHIQIPGSDDFFNFYTNGFTASAWVRLSDADDLMLAVSKKNEYKLRGWSLGFKDDYGFASIKGTGLYTDDYSAGDIIDDEVWHLIACQYDPARETFSLFVDGERVAESGTFTVTLPESEDDLVIGAQTITGNASFNGLIDEVRIWSYPIDPVVIAQLYTDKKPGEMVCIELPPNDLNEDCKIDVLDLLEIVLGWLDCNRAPQDDCY
jgi:hypothetical protein